MPPRNTVEYDEKELLHRLRLADRQKLDELMTWNGIKEISEVTQNLNAHSLSPTLSYQAIDSPHHKIEVSENVARINQAAGPNQTAHRLQKPDTPVFYISPRLGRQFKEPGIAKLQRYLGDETTCPCCFPH